MRDNTKRKAPHITVPSKKEPFSFFKESNGMKSGKPPMNKKRLSK